MAAFCVGENVEKVRVTEYISCAECRLMLKGLKGINMAEYIKNRKGLPRCRGCENLAEGYKWIGKS